jgi:REJ domain
MTNFIWYCRQVDEQLPTFPNGSLNNALSSSPYTLAQLSTLNATSAGGCFRQGPGLIRNTGKGSLTFSGRNMRVNDTYVFRVIVVKGTRNATAELYLNIVPGLPPSLVIG